MESKRAIFRGVVLLLILSFLTSSCIPQETAATPVSSVTATPVVSKKALNIWNPDSPTTLNPYFSFGMQDSEPSRIVYEPLADFDKDGKLVPVLAAEIPSLENGELAADNKSVTWKLRRDILWSDGEKLTADDVVFTYNFIIDPEVRTVATSEYGQIAKIEALDDYTVKITFKYVNPAWALPFVGIRGVILPKHIFETYKGTNARDAHANTVPIGTGPYRVTDYGIESQEVLLLGSQIAKTTMITFEPNPNYRFPEKIAFRQVIYRGGGYWQEYSRQLFETGNLHLAYWVDASRMPLDSKGDLLYTFRTGVRRLLLNFTDPNSPSPDGEYSSLQVPHPFFSDKQIRQALAYAINRQALIDKVYKTGEPAYAVLVAPPQYHSSTVFYKYDPAKAKALLDEAGYLDTNGDGFREKDGIKINLLFQSFIDPDTQIAQKLIKADLKAIGVDVVIKATDSGIMFGDDTQHPDSISRFNADLMMFGTTSNSFDPTAFMSFWTCRQIPQKANDWKAGNNNERWCNPAYDELLEKTKAEITPATREKMFIQLNDMLVEDAVMIPLVWQQDVTGVSKQLKGLDPTPWDALTWNIQDWYFSQP